MSIPKRVVIVPYRVREVHKVKFLEHMNSYLSDSNDWEIFFAHQCDNRPFNRGAMKNIGFLAIKRKYPGKYIAFVTNKFMFLNGVQSFLVCLKSGFIDRGKPRLLF